MFEQGNCIINLAQQSTADKSNWPPGIQRQSSVGTNSIVTTDFSPLKYGNNKKKFRRNEQYYSNINRAYGSLLVADSFSGWTKVHPYNKTEPMALCRKAENKEIYNAIALSVRAVNSGRNF